MRTVETYRARIKDKLHLKDANDLLQHAIRWMQAEGSL
jgi:DNA-binding CsgD family transcriptional regulator